MLRSKNLLLAWLPVLVWMGVIFGASTDLMSSRQTSRFIGPLLRWFKADVSEAAIRRVQLAVRKGAHVTEYAILALCLYRALRRSLNQPVKRWCLRCALSAFVLAVAYAGTDEWHQSFVPSRDGSLHDVLIDACGAALGLLLLWRWHLFQQARELRLVT